MGLNGFQMFRWRCVSRRFTRGLTLIELIIVLSIIVALAGLVTPRLFSTSDRARKTVTNASAIEIRDAVVRFWSDCKYSYPNASVANQRIQLADLLEQPVGFDTFDPNLRLGWNGPYLQTDGRGYSIDLAGGFTATYGQVGQATIRDVFINRDTDGDGSLDSGSPFVIQEPTLRALESTSETYNLGDPREIRIVSAGPNGVIDIDDSRFGTELEANPALQGDDIYVSIFLR